MNNFWQDTKVLMTGGTGFIGSRVVEQLVSLGAKVSVFDRMRDGVIKNIAYLDSEVQFISGDCTRETVALIACDGKVEIRPVVGGDMTKQPFFKKYMKESFQSYTKNACLVHEQGLYFGNNPDMIKKEMATIVRIFTSL